MARGQRKKRRNLLRAMRGASTHTSWRDAAEALDDLDGNTAWRADDESPYYDAALLRRHIAELDTLREAGQIGDLQATVTESLYRNLPDVSAPPLYRETHTGETKRIVGDWLGACVDALEFLRDVSAPGLPKAERRARFERAYHNFGSTALMLSGGGAWGLYHLGVVKALRDAELLPRVICGSSMGAIIASGVATRTEAELDALYARPEDIHRIAVRVLGLRGMSRTRSLFDPRQLREHVETNVGGLTFREAYERTGRVLNVSISPTRARQKPRVLSYKTAPDVLVAEATLASCSIPGLWPPVMLKAKNEIGEVVPYVPSERWVDGSMRSDLPLRRVARLHNVNHYVVSQANPGIVQVARKRSHGPVSSLARLGGALVKAQASAVLNEARQVIHDERIRPLLNTVHALVGQHYRGDIDIHPRVPARLFSQVMANPSPSQLRDYILGGERATWRNLAIVRDQTRIHVVLEACVDGLSD